MIIDIDMLLTNILLFYQNPHLSHLVIAHGDHNLRSGLIIKLKISYRFIFDKSPTS